MSECQWSGCYKEATHVIIHNSHYRKYWPDQYFCGEHGHEVHEYNTRVPSPYNELMTLEEHKVFLIKERL